MREAQDPHAHFAFDVDQLALGERLSAHVHAHTFADAAPGAQHVATAADVNSYLNEHTGALLFTAKDFRTWKASALVAAFLFDLPASEKLSGRKRDIKEAVLAAAELLGNTPTICRKYYIHPWLLESYEHNVFAQFFERFKPRRLSAVGREEQILIRFLTKCDQEPGTTAWNKLATG